MESNALFTCASKNTAYVALVALLPSVKTSSSALPGVLFWEDVNFLVVHWFNSNDFESKQMSFSTSC